MNANRKMSKAEMLRQPKKETKGGKRKQKMFLRKAIARKLGVPASSLKGKTFEELMDILDNKNIPLKEVVEGDKEEVEEQEDVKEILNLLYEPEKIESIREESGKKMREEAKKRGQKIIRPSQGVRPIQRLMAKKDELEETKLMDTKLMDTKLMKTKEIRREELEGKYDNEDDLDQAEVWQYPALGVAPNANLEVPNSSLNDNMIVSANARSAFQPNPLVPVRGQFEPIRREVLEDNENMRNDPNPEVIPPQDILEQVRILEGPEGMMPHGEPHRLPNPVVVNDPRLAQNNMGSMEQNVMMNRNMMDRRALRREMLGEGEEGKYDDAFGAMPEDDDFDELDQNEDIYNEDFEGISNRERIDEMKKIMSYQQAGKWNGNMGVGRDYARSAMIRGAEANISNVNAMRGKPLYPYKIPDRTYAGNSVNMIRNSNRSMLLQTGMLLP